MKKLNSLFLGGMVGTVLLVSAAAPTSAFAADKISVEVNGGALQSEQEPFVHNSRTFVPLRSIFEALGASIDWNAATRTVTAVKDDVTVQLTLGSNIAYRNGAPVELDAAPMVRDERSYVPVRFIAESFNTPVKWDGATKMVRLLESNRAQLEQVLSKKVDYPFIYHIDYVGNFTIRTGGKGYLGTRTSSIDMNLDPETLTYNFYSKAAFMGDVFRGTSDYELYVKDNKPYVLFKGFTNWQTSSLDQTGIEAKILNKAAVPVLNANEEYAKYAVLEETDTENILTFYLTPTTYKQMMEDMGASVLIDDMVKIHAKYHIDKKTGYWNLGEVRTEFKQKNGMEIITLETYKYSNIGKPITLTLPDAAYKATQADLSNLY